MSKSMPCPACGTPASKVLQMSSLKNARIRRRRQCTACDHRYSTVELYAQSQAELHLLEQVYKLMRKLEKVRV